MSINKLSTGFICPVCGNILTFQAWENGWGSQDICSCCGTHFGHDDFGSSFDEICESWNLLRTRWISNGMKWWSQDNVFSENSPTLNWNPQHQIQNIPHEFRSAGWDGQIKLASQVCDNSKKVERNLPDRYCCPICGYNIDLNGWNNFRRTYQCTCCRNKLGKYLLNLEVDNFAEEVKSKILQWIQSGMMWFGGPDNYDPVEQVSNIPLYYFGNELEKLKIIQLSKISFNNTKEVRNSYKKYKMCMVCGTKDVVPDIEDWENEPNYYNCPECNTPTGYTQLPLGVSFKEYCISNRGLYLSNRTKSHLNLKNIPKVEKRCQVLLLTKNNPLCILITWEDQQDNLPKI